MISKLPIGLKESQTLEFKDVRDLKEPSKLIRSIVAMLNSKGGKIWVGIDEQDECAVGVQDVKDPDFERRRIWDTIHDIVEPRLTTEAVDIQQVEESGKHALCIVVNPRDTGALHAVRVKDGAWLVPIQVDARTRPLSWLEISSRLSDSLRTKDSLLDKVRHVLARDQEEFLGKPTHYNLWVELAPAFRIALDIQALSKKYPSDFRVMDSGLGYFSMLARCDKFRLREDRVDLKDDTRFALSAYQDGRIRLIAQLDRQSFGDSRRPSGWAVNDREAGDSPIPEIHPFELIALVAIAFRMASHLYQEASSNAAGPQGRVLSRHALTGMQGVGLRSGSPTHMMWSLRLNPPSVSDEIRMGVNAELDFGLDDLLRSPDLCVLRVLRSVYAFFGFPEDAIPGEFDRKTGVLRLPGS